MYSICIDMDGFQPGEGGRDCLEADHATGAVMDCHTDAFNKCLKEIKCIGVVKNEHGRSACCQKNNPPYIVGDGILYPKG